MNRQYAVRVVIGLGAGLTALVAAELIIAIAVALAERSSSFLVALYLIFDPRQPHRHFVALGAGCLGAVVAFLLILPSGRRDWPIAALRSGALSTLIAGATLVGAAIGWLFFLLVTVLALRRGKHALKRYRQVRPAHMMRRRSALLLVSYFVGLLLIGFGITWTWSPTLKMRLKYNPTFVVILWLVGDLLLLRHLRTEHDMQKSDLRSVSWRL